MRLDSPGGSTPKKRKVAAPKKVAPQVTLQPKKSVSRTTSSSSASRTSPTYKPRPSTTARVPSYFRERKQPQSPFPLFSADRFKPETEPKNSPSFAEFFQSLAQQARSRQPQPSYEADESRPGMTRFFPNAEGPTYGYQRTTDVKKLRDLPVGKPQEPKDETLPDWAQRNPLSGAIQPKKGTESYAAFKGKYNLIQRGANTPAVYDNNLNETFSGFLEMRSMWAQNNLKRDMRERVEAVEEATRRLRKGEFDYLEQRLEEDPDFLEIPRMRDHFPSATPRHLTRQFNQMLDATEGDFEAQNDVDRYMTGQLKVAEALKNYGYRLPRQKLQRKLQEYEKKRKESIDYFQDRPDELPDGVNINDDSGKILKGKEKEENPFKGVLGKKNAAKARQIAKRNKEIDLIKAMDGMLDVEGMTPEEVMDREIKSIKKGLFAGRGKQYRMPTPDDMLQALVESGEVDPEDAEEVELAQLKLNNPLHPQTRALYTAFAISQGLIDGSDDSKETLDEFIGAPMQGWVHRQAVELKLDMEREEKEYKESTEGKIIGNLKDSAQAVAGTIPGIGGFVAAKEGYDNLDDDGLTKKIIDEVVVDPAVWTIDKLERPINATAAVVNEWQEQNKNGDSWLTDGNLAQRVVAGAMTMSHANLLNRLFTGHGFEDSYDNLDASSPVELAKAGWKQFTRGQDDMHYDFRHVIADAADRPGTPSYLDSQIFQTLGGSFGNVVADPINLTGIGLVRNGVKVSGFTIKTLPRSLRQGVEELNKIDSDYFDVDGIVKALNDRMPIGANMDKRTFNAYRTRVLQGFADDLNIAANTSIERLNKASNLSLSPQRETILEELNALQNQRAAAAVDFTIGSARSESRVHLQKMVDEGKLSQSVLDDFDEVSYFIRQERIAPRGSRDAINTKPGAKPEKVRMSQEIWNITNAIEAGAKEAGFTQGINKFTKEYNDLRVRLEARHHDQGIIERELERFSKDYAKKYGFKNIPQPKQPKGDVYAYTNARNEILKEMDTLSKTAKADRAPDFEARFNDLGKQLSDLESAFTKGYKSHYESVPHLGYDLRGIARQVFGDNFRFTNEFDELDFYEALSAGKNPSRFSEEDQQMYNGYKRQIESMRERIASNKKQMLNDGLPEHKLKELEADTKRAWQRMGHLWDDVNAMEGAYRIRYMQALASANVGKPVFKNQKQGEFLQKLIDRLDAQYEPRNLEQHSTHTGLRNDKRDSYGDEAAHGDFNLDLKLNESVEYNIENLMSPDERFRDPTAQYNAVRNALHKALSDELVVRPVGPEGRKGARISSIPQLNSLIKSEVPSSFMSNGKLDREKVLQYITFDPQARQFGYSIPKGAGKEEVQFLRDFSYTLRDVYNRSYNALYQHEQRQALTKRKAKKAKKGKKKDTREKVEGFVYAPINSAWDKAFPEGLDREGFIDIFTRGDEDELFELLGAAGSPFKISHQIDFKVPSLSASDNSRLKTYKTASTIRSFLEKELKLSRAEADDILRQWVLSAMEKKWGLHQVGKNIGNPERFKYAVDDGIDPSKTLDELEGPSEADLEEIVQEQLPKRKIVQQAGEIFGNTVKAVKISEKNKKADTYVPNVKLDAATVSRLSSIAAKHSKDEVFKFVDRFEGVPFGHHNARAEIKLSPTQTIRSEVMENYRAARTALENERDALRAEKKVAKSRAEIKEIDTKLKDLKTQYDELLGEAKKSADLAVDTIKAVTARMREDVIIQSAHVDKHSDINGIRFMLAGFKADMMFSPQWIERFESLAEFPVLKQFVQEYRKTFQPPSQALGGGDMALAYARFTNNTPEIIRQNLEMLSKKMGRIDPDTRQHMFRHFKDVRNVSDKSYNGPKMEMYHGVESYINHVEDVFNQRNPSYLLEDRSVFGTSYLTLSEINRYLPTESKLSLGILRRKGTGKITVNDIFNSMSDYRKRNNIAKSYDKTLDDPFRFGHVMSMAIEQAMARRALNNALIDTFGIRRQGTFKKVEGKDSFIPSENARIEQLGKMGWETIEELGNSAYFPKESAGQIRKLLSLVNDPRQIDEFANMFDEITGMWKAMQTIYNPGWYVRNGVGEAAASWFMGVNTIKPYKQAMKVIKYRMGKDVEFESLTKHYPMINQIMKNERPVGRNQFIVRVGGRDFGVADVEVAFRDMGLKSGFIHNDLRRGAKQMGVQMDPDKELGAVRSAAGRINNKVQDAGEHYEDFFRMAHFIDALQKSKARSFKEAAKEAADQVRRSHFDYKDYNSFEKAYLMRAFPFYKWTRKSIPFFTSMFFMKPGKMLAAPKALTGISGLLSSQDVYDDENGFLPNYQGMAPAFVADLFAYQTNEIENEPGYNNYFRLPLPQMDFLAFANEPQGSVVSMLNPLFKIPADMGLSSQGMQTGNFQMFGGGDPGETSFGVLQDSEYRQSRDIGPTEGFLRYLAKYTPGTDLIGKHMANNDEIYGNEQKYPKNSLMQLSTKLGVGMYQAFPQGEESGNVNGNEVGPVNPPAVGGLGLPEVPMSSGRKAASRNPKYELANLLSILEGTKE